MLSMCIQCHLRTTQTVVVFGVPYTPDYYKNAGGAITIIFSLFPWDLLAKGFQDLGAAALGPSPGACLAKQYFQLCMRAGYV